MQAQKQSQIVASPDALDQPQYAARRTKFLDTVGWGGVEIEPLPFDASYRRYYRLHGGSHPALLMDSVLDVTEPVENWIKVGAHLHRLGITVPEIYKQDLVEKLLIIEDFGDDVFHFLIEAADDPTPYYELAVDTLISIHTHPDVMDVDLPVFGVEDWVEHIVRFVDWYYPSLKGQKMPDTARTEFIALWEKYFPIFERAPRNFVHYDFIPENLMRVADKNGVESCGLIDFQIACFGPCSWDLVGLLEQARRPVDLAIQDAMKRRYLSARPDLDEQAFMESYVIFAAQRNIRILGNFTRLFVRDGKPKYLGFIPHIQQLIARYLENPALADLKTWFDRYDVDITESLPDPIERHEGFPL